MNESPEKTAKSPVRAPVRQWLLRYASVIAALAAWEFSVRVGGVDPFLLPSLSSVLARGWEEVISGEVPYHALLTIYRALFGFLIATVLGIIIGTLTARNRFCRWFFEPLVSVGFPMPKIAFMAIFILWFGIGDTSKIVMIVVTCIFPVVSATYIGTSNVDHYLVWSARMMGTSENMILWKIVMPASLPQILSGLQIAFPTALIVTVVTEMISSGGGLGGYMILAGRFALSEKVFVGIVAIAIVGYVLLTIFSLIRRRLLLWHAESQQAL